MSQKFKSDIEAQAGIRDSSGAIGTSGQVLSSTGSNVSWINQTTVASDVQNQVKAGVAINKGQAVYVTGADGTNIIVGLASNTSEATSSKTLGLLNATVAVNGFADVVQIGRLAGLNTIGAAAGDPVWLGTNGNLIYGLIGKPYAPANLVFIGIVTRVNSNNGEIFVSVQNGFELNEIHDVDLKTTVPINGDVLGFNGTLWVNKTIAQWLGYTPANASGTTNYVSKFTGATTLGNSQIFDNGTNVGIGTTSPAWKLDVSGLGRFRDANTYEGAFIEGTNGIAYFGSLATDAISLYSSGLSRVYINSGGNVGIGTTAPQAKLHINNGTDRNLWFRVNGSGTGTELLSINDAQSTRQSLAFSASSFYFDNGNVGIGTLNPSEKLDVNGMAKFGSILTNGSNGSGGQEAIRINNDNGYIGFFNSANSVRSGYLQGNTTDVTLTTSTSTPLIFGTANTEKMRITSSGNVGIGTSNPLDKLDVLGNQFLGDGANTTQLHLRGVVNVSYAWNIKNLYTGFQVKSTSPGAGDGFNIDFSNRVGIGITSPNSLLQVGSSNFVIAGRTSAVYGPLDDNNIFTVGASGTDYPILVNIGVSQTNQYGVISVNQFTSSARTLVLQPNGGDVTVGTTAPLLNTGGRGNITINGSYESILVLASGGVWKSYLFNDGVGNTYLTSAGVLNFGTNGSDRMRIDNSGNVGIGTTNPISKLNVNTTDSANNVITVTNGTQELALGVNNGSGGSFLFENSNSALRFGTAGSERMRITNNGNVGIGTTTPSSNLTVVRNANNASYITTFSNTNAGTSANTISEWKVNGYSSFVIGKSNSDGRVEIAQIGNNNIDFINNGINVMSIDTNQNVIVNGTTAEACAQLEVKSTTQGFLPPRMTTGERDAIGSPVNGLLIWNTDNRQLEVYAVGTWLGLATV